MVSKKQSLRFIPSSISLILLSESNRSARITIEKNKIMSIEKVKAYFATLGREKEVMEFPVSSATVELAAQALSVEPARIAKTLSFQGEDENHCILIVTAGDAKIDNSKFRHFFKMKARMFLRKWQNRQAMPSEASAPSLILKAYELTWIFPCKDSTPFFRPAAVAIQPSNCIVTNYSDTPWLSNGSTSVNKNL